MSCFFKYRPNLLHKYLKVLYFTWFHILNSLSIHDPNNKRSTNPDICSWLYMFLSLCPVLSQTKFKITNFSHSPCKNIVWMSTTCFTSMYKNMYKPKSKTRLIILSSIAYWNSKSKQAKTRNEVKRRLMKPIDWSKLIFLKPSLFIHILKKLAPSLLGLVIWSVLLLHSVYT